ncbi:MAG: glycosyltransferase family 39 protein, partial [Candidatus Kerfeldbacteria bacterium]|nr:glycosyltransferase family 39 protein [Candidatus Kerfeldbacteria bacterium]
ASRVAAGLPMAAPLPIELHGQSLTYPRNAWVIDDAVVPASFLGLVDLYGLIGRVLGRGAILFLTPVFSALAIIALYGLVDRIWSRRVALLSACLLAIQPVFWYYSARGMFHNVLFFDLIIIGAWALSLAVDWSHGRHWRRPAGLGLYLVAGLSIGQALAVRTAEIGWVALLLLSALWLMRRRLDLRYGLWIGIVGLCVPMAILFAHNAEVFGSPTSFGYSRGLAESAVSQGWSSALVNLVLPFGLDVVQAATNVWKFGVVLTWWISVPVIIGFVLAYPRPSTSSARRAYWWMFLALAVWLAAYYGSWTLHDEPNPDAITIGTSYTRYWLPIYVLGLPFAALCLERLLTVKRHGRRWLGGAAAAILAVSMTWLSVDLVIADEVQGLAVIRQHGVNYSQLANEVAHQTPPNAVIISGRGDKFLFPERSVIYAVENRDDVRTVVQLMTRVPMYVYVSPVESRDEVKRFWDDQKLELTSEQRLSDDGRLYRLEIPTND